MPSITAFKFKKVMEVPDTLILRYFELATDVHPNDITHIKAQLESGENPRNIKYQLAEIIIGLYHTPEEVEKAKDFYDAAFSKKTIPEDLPVLCVTQLGTLQALIPELVNAHFAASNSELRRLITQGGLQINDKKITDLETIIHTQDVLKIGKKKFVRIQ